MRSTSQLSEIEDEIHSAMVTAALQAGIDACGSCQCGNCERCALGSELKALQAEILQELR